MTDVALPAALEIERLVLGAMLTDVEAAPMIAGSLQGDDFSLTKHRLLFAAACALIESGEHLDAQQLGTALRKAGKLEAVDGIGYIVSLDDDLPRVFGLDGYIRTLRQKTILRQAAIRAQALLAECCHPSADIAAVSRAEEFLRSLTERTNQRSLRGLEEHLAGAGGIDGLLHPNGRELIVPTPWKSLSEILLGGFRASQLVILAARPGMGKSTAAAQIGVTAALAGHGTDVFSFEMNASQIWRRMVAHHAQISLGRINRGGLSLIDRHAAVGATTDLAEAPLWIDEESNCTVPALVGAVRKQRSSGRKPSLIVVDYLQLLQTTRRRESRVQEITEISRQLKIAARELRIPLLVLSQLSRDSEKDNGRRPELTDLRESGCLIGNTLVTMSDSGERIPISSLVGKTGFGVHGWDLLEHRSVGCSRAFSTGVRPVYRVRTASGREITATANHRFYSHDSWKRVDELTADDEIAICAEIPEPKDAINQSADEMYFLGHMIGNGCLLPSHAHQCTTRDKHTAEHIAEAARSVFGSGICPRIIFDNPRNQGGWHQVFFKSTRRHTHGVRSVVSEWAETKGIFGKRAHEKRLPASIWRASNENLLSLLAGLWESDGSIGTGAVGNKLAHGYGYYSTASDGLAGDIMYLLSRLGILCSAGVVRKGEYRPVHHVRLTGGREALTLFANRIPFRSMRHIESAREVLVASERLVGSSTTTKEIMNGIMWDRVRSVEYAGEEECFDLTVPATHNFEANGIVTHNSIEQDADTVIFLWQDRKERNSAIAEKRPGAMEMIVRKQRDGPVGFCRVLFDPRTMTIHDGEAA